MCYTTSYKVIYTRTYVLHKFLGRGEQGPEGFGAIIFYTVDSDHLDRILLVYTTKNSFQARNINNASDDRSSELGCYISQNCAVEQ